MSIFRAIKYRRCWQVVVLGLFFLSSGLYSCTARADTTTGPTKHHLVSVSYLPNSVGQIITGQPLVQVILNGTTTATFFIDTGTDSCVISQSLAKKLNLPLAPAVDSTGKPYFFKGGAEQSTMGRVSKINIGGLIFNDQAMVVAEEKAFVLRPGVAYDGVIGMKLLRYVALLLDTQQHILTFCYPGTVEVSQLVKLGFTTPYVLPLADDEGVRWVQAQFANLGITSEERLMLDIGSNKTCVPKRLAKQLDLKSFSQQQEINLFGNDTVDAVRVGEIHLGQLTLFDFPLTVFNKEMNTKKLAAPSVLGLDILSGYRVLMDFPGGKLYLQPNTTVPAITIGPAPATAPPPVK